MPIVLEGPSAPQNTDAIGIATCEQSGPRRGTDRLGHIKVSEAHAFLGHAVEIRRFQILGAVTADVGVSLVVGQDDDDIWRTLLFANFAADRLLHTNDCTIPRPIPQAQHSRIRFRADQTTQQRAKQDRGKSGKRCLGSHSVDL